MGFEFPVVLLKYFCFKLLHTHNGIKGAVTLFLVKLCMNISQSFFSVCVLINYFMLLLPMKKCKSPLGLPSFPKLQDREIVMGFGILDLLEISITEQFDDLYIYLITGNQLFEIRNLLVFYFNLMFLKEVLIRLHWNIHQQAIASQVYSIKVSLAVSWVLNWCIQKGSFALYGLSGI